MPTSPPRSDSSDRHHSPRDQAFIASLGTTPTAAFIAALDWSRTPIGALASWPEPLRTAVSLICRSSVPMALLWGAQGTMLYNQGYAVVAGDRHPAALGRPVLEVWPDAADFNRHNLQTGLAGESLSFRDVCLVFERNGRTMPARFDLDYSPVFDEDGVPCGVLAVVTETTERAAAETAMREADLRNRQILDSAVDYAIIAADLQGRVTRWNEGAHRILGWSEAEMLGRPMEAFFTPEDRAAGRLRAEMRDALATGAGNDERWHERKSGERFWASGELMPIRAHDGTALGFVKVLRDRSEEHRVAEALKQSERRLQRAQEAGGVGTFALDMVADRVYGTREFYRIFGVPEGDSAPASVFEELVLKEDTSVRSDAARRAMEAAPLDVEYRIRRRSDGQLRWIARKAEFERDAQGVVTRMVGVVQDITERRATEQALRDSEAQFRTFAQALPNHVWTALADGRLDWLNAQVYAYSGAAAGTLEGAGWAGLVHADDAAQAESAWRRSVATGQDYETEFRIRRADGAYRWHLIRALPLRSGSGQISRWIGTNTDIHERKLAQVAVTRDLDRVWTLSQELMLICDFNGVISAVNPTARRLLGWADDAMIGRTLAEFIHPDDVGATAAEVDKLAQGITTLAFENRYRAQDGSYRLLSWTAVPDAGSIHAVARDVTRERQTEEALRQSQKLEAIGQLTGGVAHDFNNVLAVIKTSIDLLKRLPPADERRHRFMDSISNAVARATRLTAQLLAFARRQALQPAVFDAGHNTRAVSEMIASLTGARIAVELKLAAKACYVHADPNQFDTALVNLAVNARDAMSRQGRMVIEVAAVNEIPARAPQPAVPGRYVAVAVRDTGTGIAPEHLLQIFEPFFTTKGVGHGTGLGLSQVFGFAKQSGGDIRVDSVLGQGSTFTLYLPRAPRPGETPAAAEEREAIALGNGGCVLLVEDNVELSASVEQTLLELGYTTVVAASAEAALRELHADAGRFVAVFSDVVMAGMSGVDLGHAIRRLYGSLPVVLTSGYSHALSQTTEHDFTLLQKPYALADLARVLHEAIVAGQPGPRTSPPRTPKLPASDREDARQAELAALRIMDTEQDDAYDEITRLAARFCNTPTALISLVDDRRQWFKARVGLQAQETPREHAFCAHAIQEPGRVMVVGDASADDRFAANPLVTGDPNIRFYAGAPLVTSGGHALGTLCVIDSVPRELDVRQLEVLQFLANQVVERMEKRRALERPDDAEDAGDPAQPDPAALR